jgi:hypothetical protein
MSADRHPTPAPRAAVSRAAVSRAAVSRAAVARAPISRDQAVHRVVGLRRSLTGALVGALALLSLGSGAAAHAAPYTPRADWSRLEALVFDQAATPSDLATEASEVMNAIVYETHPAKVQDADGRTALMVAVLSGNQHYVECLLSDSATGLAGGAPDLERKDRDGRTALDHARAGGSAAMVALLERGALFPSAPDAGGVAATALASDSDGWSGPIGLGLVGPLDLIQDRRKDFTGLSVNLLQGSLRTLKGVQVGPFNHTRLGGGGAQLGAVNTTGDAFIGLQAGAINFTTRRFRDDEGRNPGCYGLCMGGANVSGGGAGIHAGLVNTVVEGRGLLQVGAGNVATREMNGVMIGLIGNHVQRDFNGLQIGLANYNNVLQSETGRQEVGNGLAKVTIESTWWSGTTQGVQLGVVINTADKLDGLQIGATNLSRGRLRGVQVGVFNVGGVAPDSAASSGVQLSGLNMSGDFAGLQLGGVNGGRDVTGVQFGLINIARRLNGGVQVGAINIAWKQKIPVTVLFNAG